MADEISFSYSLSATKSNYSQSFSSDITIDMSGVGGTSPGVINVGTSWENITPDSEIDGSEGLMRVTNLDSTNFVLLAAGGATATDDAFSKVKAGESYVIRLNPGSQIEAQFDTAAGNCLFEILPD